MLIKDAFRKLENVFYNRVDTVNETFNKLPKQRQKSAVIVFGICVTVISVFLILQASTNQKIKNGFKPDRITMPYDIFMKDETKITEDQLTPVGKMKGEI